MKHDRLPLLWRKLLERFLDEARHGGIRKLRFDGSFDGREIIASGEVLGRVAPLPKRVPSGIRSDGKEPRSDGSTALIPASRADDRQEGGLQQVLGERAIVDHPEQERLNRPGVPPVELVERGLTSLAELIHQHLVRGLSHRRTETKYEAGP